MDQIRIVADSSCNILALDGVEFVSVPLTIRTDTEEFRDDAALDVNEMVTVLRNTKGRSYSACPNITDWEEAFGDSGDVLAFTITSSLSGSYNAACIARDACQERDPSRRIYVVDSLSAGPEIGLLIERALSEVRAGADFGAVCRAVKAYHERTHLLFALESMHNLAQNGRISKLAATMAGVLGIRAVGQASAEGTLEMWRSAGACGKRGSSCCTPWRSWATRAAVSGSGIVRIRRWRWSFARRSSRSTPART